MPDAFPAGRPATVRATARTSRWRSPSSSARSPGASAPRPTGTSGPLGITWSQLRALRTVDRCDGAIRMSELASRLGIARRSATSVVDDLVGHGLLERRDDPADRRAVEVAVTAAGTRLLRRLAARRRSAAQEVTAACRPTTWRSSATSSAAWRRRPDDRRRFSRRLRPAERDEVVSETEGRGPVGRRQLLTETPANSMWPDWYHVRPSTWSVYARPTCGYRIGMFGMATSIARSRAP